MTPFHERAEQMGLDITHAEDKGMYSYNDIYGDIIYRQLVTTELFRQRSPFWLTGKNINRSLHR